MSEVYAFKARAATGAAHSGTITAESQSEALKKLQERGLVVTHLEITRDLGAQLRASRGKQSLFTRPMPAKDLSMFCRQFAVLFGSGVTIMQSLRTLEQQTSHRELKARLRQVTQAVVAGEGLGAAMKRHPEVFPALLYNMVAAGEVSGALETVLDKAASHFEREHAIETRVKSALFYPKLVVGTIVLVVTFLLVFVVPRFAELFAGMGVALPLPTRILIGLGEFMASWWWAVGIGFGATYAAVMWYKTTPRGRVVLDRLSLRLPIFGELNRMNFVSRFCRNLATLSRSGVPIVPAMILVRTTIGNRVLEDALRPAEEAIKAGQGISVQLARSGFFPPLVTQMVAVGEETGALDTMLERASDFYDGEIKALTDRLAQLIEPIVFLVLGVVVTFIILAVMLPMFDTFRMVQ
ncbi:MAG: Type II secretion system protein F [Firmicutes bacterium]|nr:Type II secretion system protein F [candidate division NPL-UPA2 bacterium]